MIYDSDGRIMPSYTAMRFIRNKDEQLINSGCLYETSIVNNVALLGSADFNKHQINVLKLYFGGKIKSIPTDVVENPIEHLGALNTIQKHYKYSVLTSEVFNLYTALENQLKLNFISDGVDFDSKPTSGSKYYYQYNFNSRDVEILTSINNEFDNSKKRIIFSVTLKLSDKFHFKNFRTKLDHFISNISKIENFNDSEFDTLNKLNYFMNNQHYTFKFLNNDINDSYRILKHILNLDLIEDTNAGVINFEHTKKRFEFITKYASKLTKINSLKFGHFKVKIKMNGNRGIFNHILVQNFPGREYIISTADQLYKLEQILYACNDYDNYQIMMRQLILTLV